MSPDRRRRIGALLIIMVGLTALAIPFLLRSPSPSSTTTPPPPGGTTPPSSGGGGTGVGRDIIPPQTTLAVAGAFRFPREGYDYYYPSLTVTLHASDDIDLSTVYLNDTGMVRAWNVSGTSTSITWTTTSLGIHKLTYWSADRAGNNETRHSATARLAKPGFNDLLSLISNSHIDSQGIKNALSVKAEHAQDMQARGHDPNSLDALANQINGLSGKHGLDQDLANMLLSMIKIIIG